MPIMHVHACAHPRDWLSFKTVFNHLIWPYKCLLLVNMGSVCVCFDSPENRYLNNIPVITFGGAGQHFDQNYSQLFA